MSSDFDKDFFTACQRREWDRIPQMLAQGADATTADDSGRTVLFVLAGDIARTWPAHQDVLEMLLNKGADLNTAAVNGSAMHALSFISGTHADEERRQNFQTFLREAVNHYGGDLGVKRGAARNESAAIEDIVRNAKSFDSVARTGMALMNEKPDMLDDAGRASMARTWLISTYRQTASKTCEHWFAAGVPMDAATPSSARTWDCERALELYDQWQEQNPKLDPKEVSGLEQVFACTERDPNGEDIVNRKGSPLFRPENWRQMGALLEACAANGDGLTKERALEPLVEDKNFVQLAAEIACQPRAAIQLCNANGIQLGAKELLEADGSPNATLQSLIDVKAANLLFTQNNWKGKHPAELHKVLNALPELDRGMVRNVYQLRAHMQDTNQTEMGRA